jgi:hypothetical protein
MARLRRLTKQGVDEFRQFLQRIREGAEFQSNPAILNVDGYSARVEPAIDVERLEFKNKYEAGQYLVSILAAIDSPSLATDVGLWSWLTLFYFDQLAPKRPDGTRRPREDYHYIPGSNATVREPHLLAVPYRLVRDHGEQAKLPLYPKLHEHGDFVYRLTFHRELLSSRSLIEAMSILYWDSTRNRPKSGATTKTRPGNLRRLITVLQQLDFNYDLYGMNAAEILELLPREFDSWKTRSVS